MGLRDLFRPSPVRRRRRAFVGNDLVTLHVAVPAAVEALERRALLSTVTLAASADAYVRSGVHAETEFGVTEPAVLRVKQDSGNNGPDAQRHSYIKFSLAGLSSMPSVASATLRLWGKAETSSPSPTIEVAGHTATGAWAEATINWNNRPAASAGPIDEADVVGTTDKWYAWDVGSYLRAQYEAAATDVTLVLKGTANTDSVQAKFFSKDHADAAHRPQLVVDSLDFRQNAGGELSIEAENHSGVAAGGGKNWTSHTTTPDHSGAGAIRAMSNTGAAAWNPGDVGNAPRVDYRVRFTSAGTHYVWVRGHAPGGTGDDSVHVGLNGAAPSTTSIVNGFTSAGYSWKGDNGPPPPGVSLTRAAITVPSAGIHTVNLWMREDGVVVDKLFVTNDANDTPTGTGPAETPNVINPDGLAATAASATQVDLTWADRAKSETGYAVQRATNSTFTTGVENFTGIAADATSYPDTTAAGGTTYHYRVRATTAGGESGWSAAASVTTPPPVPITPAAPTGLSAVAAGESQIGLSWSDNSNNETAFQVEYSLDGSGFIPMGTLGAGSTSYTWEAALPGTLQYFRVIALNGSDPSQPSNTASVRTVLPAPEGLAAAVLSASAIDLRWYGVETAAESPVTTQTLERREDGGSWASVGTLSAQATTYSDTGLDEGTTYEYRLKRSNAAGSSPYAETFAVRTIPAPPTNLTAADVEYGATLQWSDASDGETGFRIEVMPDGGTWRTLAETSSDVTSYSAEALAPRLGYTFRVRAFNGSGESADSNTATSWSDYGEVIEPIVRVQATRDQVAEGGSEPGQFTIYRDGRDYSQSLEVAYEVDSSSTATADEDYTALSGTVTIPAYADSVTVDVSALTDTETSEETESVTVNLIPGNYTLVSEVPDGSNLLALAVPGGQATVNVLNRKQYLISFYGLGGPGTYGDLWLERMLQELSPQYSAWKEYKHFEGGEALREVLGSLNVDGTDENDQAEISKAEAESADLFVVGFSYGGTQAINFSRDLNKDVWFGGRTASVVGFTLKHTVPVKKVVSLDPVETVRVLGASAPVWKHRTGAVENNVESFINFYQKSRKVATFVQRDQQGNVTATEKVGDTLDSAGAWLITGGMMPSNAQGGEQIRIDIERADDLRYGDRVYTGSPATPHQQWELYGHEANHLSTVWWCYENAKSELTI